MNSDPNVDVVWFRMLNSKENHPEEWMNRTPNSDLNADVGLFRLLKSNENYPKYVDEREPQRRRRSGVCFGMKISQVCGQRKTQPRPER